MGLEEGFRKTADKGGSEIRIARCHEQGLQERKAGSFQGSEQSQPLLLLHLVQPQKTAELPGGDGEAFAELFHGKAVKEILRKDTEDKEQTIAGVRDDEVWEDGMGMAAGTNQAQDAKVVADGGAVYEVDQVTAVVGMNPAGAFCPTAGAGLEFGAEPGHEGIKQGF